MSVCSVTYIGKQKHRRQRKASGKGQLTIEESTLVLVDCIAICALGNHIICVWSRHVSLVCEEHMGHRTWIARTESRGKGLTVKECTLANGASYWMAWSAKVEKLAIQKTNLQELLHLQPQ